MPALELPGLTLSRLDMDSTTAKFDLTLSMSDSSQGLVGSLEYNTDLFNADTISRMLGHFQTLLEGIVANPSQRLADLPLLTAAEQQQLLVEWNRTQEGAGEAGGAGGANACIHSLFEAQVERTPDAIAVVFDDEQLTYRELNARANQLAHHLQALGVKPEVLVGICVERSVSMLVGLLGILKAGGAYVPLDPAYPQERLAFMLSDAQVSVLLTQKQLVEKLPDHQAHLVCLDTDWEAIAKQSQENPVSEVTADNLAYVIYTSGSTGKPKGVAIEHHSTVALLHWARDVFAPQHLAGVLASTSICFDLSVFELFVPLSWGGKCILAENALHLPTLPAALDVTLINTVPSAIADLLRADAIPHSVRSVNVAGEPLQNRLVQQLYQRDSIQQVFNLYGPSEDTTYSTFALVQKGDSIVTIGRAITNTQVYLLDRHLQPVPIGVPGELYIGGAGLARGYLNRPELTAERFIPNPFSKAEGRRHKAQGSDRLYKTGDLARYLPDGNIEYLGRLDNQVKIRGFRIELGEIEAALNQHPALQESVVIAREDVPGNKRLVAYVVVNQTPAPTMKELHQFLKQKLPDYMVPSTFVMLDTLPLTPNGKVDRRALPAPEMVRKELLPTFVAPKTPIEEMLALMWGEVLGIEQVGIDDNFFELGGHSLLATQLVSRVRSSFAVELPLRSLFEAPSVKELAECIETAIGLGQQLPVPPLLPRTQEQAIPLSFAQARLWFLNQLQPDSAVYNIPAAVRLSGRLNAIALEQSLNQIMTRHEALRTNFITLDGEPVQVIAETLNVSLPVVDLRCLPETQRETEWQRLATQEAVRPFNLATGPLVRATLLQLAETEHILLLTMHHIISDGWSMGVLVRESVSLYSALCIEEGRRQEAEGRRLLSDGDSTPTQREQPTVYGVSDPCSLQSRASAQSIPSASCPLPSAFLDDLPTELPQLPIQYADFAIWQRQWCSGEVLETQLSYWKHQLSDAPAVLELPTDRPRPAIQTFRGAHQPIALPKELSEGVRTLSQRQGVTLFMTLLATFQTLLYRYTGQTDILVGTPIANRNRAEIEPLIGLFVNTLVLRTDLGGNPTFVDVLSRVREVALAAYAHQDVPFEQLVEALQPARELSHTPLFQVMFVLQNAPMPALEFPGLKVSPVAVENLEARFDLTLLLENTEQGLSGSWEYNSDLFDAATIARMAGHFQTLLEGIVVNPNQQLSDLPLLSADERQQLLVEWNDTEADYPVDACIHQLFEAQVERTPDAIAVVFEDEQLTYRELNSRANQLAHHLQALGVEPEVLVGICLERSVEMVVGCLSILKAGGAYVPLDPTYPSERLAFMLEDTQTPILLSQQRLVEGLPNHGAKVVCLDTDWKAIAQQSQDNPASCITADNLAYVMYTSGSTGTPKGVSVIHRGVVRLVKGNNYVSLSPEEVFLQLAPISFDASTFEIWGSLLNGARLVVMPAHIPSLQELGQALRQYQVTTLWLTAGLFHLMVDEQIEDLKSVRQLLAGGDVLSVSHVKKALQELKGCRLVNGYGPTENTTFTCCYPITEPNQVGMSIPIGRPIANTRCFLLDDQLQPVPIGVPGELYIGGDGLARSYLNRPDLTAERFIPNPFSDQPGARLYKTGDLARYLSDGNIEFLGRLDNQVKIRGFRIELGEIEVALSQHPDVLQNVVIVREDIPGDKRLVAYLVPQPETALSTSELRCLLKQKLPDYMVPSFFVMLDTLPLTVNGKVDRRALPAPEMARSELSQTFVAPKTPIQEMLALMWAEVLGIEQVGIHDNFFELGGHSLLATQLIGRVREAFSIELPLRDLFESPTIAGLSEVIETVRQAGEGLQAPAIEPLPRDGNIPLSFAQARLWFLNQLEGGSATYNIPVALRLTGFIDVAALEQAIGEIVQRHEVLRTTFHMVNGVPVQVIAPTSSVPLSVVDLQALPEEEQSTEVQRLATEDARAIFDLTNSPLLRVTLLRLEEKSHVLLLVMHHIISDGWSLGIFVRELSTVYEAFSKGAPSPLPALAVQYADFTRWQQQWLNGEVLEVQLNYWQQQLAGAPSLLELPTDRSRPPVQTFRGSIHPVKLDRNLTQKLKNLSQQSGATLFMTLLAAFVTLLSRYSGQQDIVVGSPIANRNRAEVEGLIGFFANTLALRTDLSGDPTFTELLSRVREVTMGAYAHQDLPFEKLVEAVQPERALSRNPLVQVVFALQNAPIPSLELPGLKLDLWEFDFGTVRFDLEVLLREVPEGLSGHFVYSTDLFDSATIARMAGHFQTLLESIAANSEQRLSELPLLMEAERQQLLVSSNGVQTDSDPGNEEQMLAQLDGLSDEEVNALLNQMLGD
jgi:amino acid adenylation domain-containing protein